MCVNRSPEWYWWPWKQTLSQNPKHKMLFPVRFINSCILVMQRAWSTQPVPIGRDCWPCASIFYTDILWSISLSFKVYFDSLSAVCWHPVWTLSRVALVCCSVKFPWSKYILDRRFYSFTVTNACVEFAHAELIKV